MVDWTLEVLKETLWGSLGIVKTLVMVIIPIMIMMQLMMDYKWLEKLSHKTKFITDFLGVSKDALIPLLIGIFAGISYGAGAIFFAKEQYHLQKKDVFLIMCFLVVCHGVVETSLIFWLIGVNPLAILSARFLLAILLTLFFKKRLEKKQFPEETLPSNVENGED